jgi:hypothetical protein
MKKIIFILGLLSLSFILSCNIKPIEPNPQFIKIQYHYGFYNELDTFTGVYQKDLVQDGIARTEFYLTDSEQVQIINKIQSVDFFAFPDTINSFSKTGYNVSVDPDPGIQFLKIEYEGKTKSVFWCFFLPNNISFVPELKEITFFIQKIIEAKPEYKKLPAARGGRC